MITKDIILSSLASFCDNDSVWKEIKLITRKKDTNYSRVDVNGKFYSFIVLGESEAGDVILDDIKKALAAIDNMREDKHDLTLVLPNKVNYKEVIKYEQFNYVDSIKVWLVGLDGKLSQIEDEEPDEPIFRNEGE